MPGPADDGVTPAPSTPTTPTTIAADSTAELAATCSAIIDRRDPSIGEAATDATIELLEASTVGDEAPADATVAGWADALTSWRDELVATRDTLGDVQADDAASWQVVIAVGEAEIETLDERIAALGDGWGDEGPDIAFGAALPPEALDEALIALGLVGRDCEVVWNPDVGAAGDEWTVAAAAACRAIVDRRAGNDFTEQTMIMIEQGLVPALESGELRSSPDLVDAVDAVLVEWRATGDDLRAVGGDAAPDSAEAWALAIEYADEQVVTTERRLDALSASDADAFVERPALVGLDWRGTTLEHRDCRSVGA